MLHARSSTRRQESTSGTACWLADCCWARPVNRLRFRRPPRICTAFPTRLFRSPMTTNRRRSGLRSGSCCSMIPSCQATIGSPVGAAIARRWALPMGCRSGPRWPIRRAASSRALLRPSGMRASSMPSSGMAAPPRWKSCPCSRSRTRVRWAIRWTMRLPKSARLPSISSASPTPTANLDASSLQRAIACFCRQRNFGECAGGPLSTRR